MDDLTLQLSARVGELTAASLTPRVIEAARIRLLDSIACAFGAFDAEFCVRMRQVLSNPPIAGGIALWGTHDLTTAENAAFANAVMVRYLDLNDTVLGLTGGHPSDMIPALVVLAQEREVSGIDLLRSIIIAYELYCGLCQAVRLAEAGIDQAIAAAMGTAGGAAFLLGLDQTRIAHAISLAVVANAALFNVRMGDLSEWKACAGPYAAARGLFAARLAAAGVSGPSGIFTGQGGLATITGPITWPKPAEPLILLTHLKLHPVCYHGQSAVDAAIFLHDRLQGGVIERVTIEVNQTAHHVMGSDPSRWHPENRETADHSLPYCVAVALLRGSITSGDFSAQNLHDPLIFQLMQRIEVIEDQTFTAGDPNTSPARLTLWLSGRNQLVEEVTFARGHAGNPINQKQLEAKLAALWPEERPVSQAQAMMEAVADLPSAPSLQRLISALNP